MVAVQGEEPCVPASPFSRLMHTPNFNLNVITVMGSITTLDVNWIKQSVSQSLAKHPRFSSILVVEDEDKFKMSWKTTEVNIDNHVFVLDLDPETELEKGDKFVDEFITKVAQSPMDLSKPLWELYLLNVKTSNSAATAVLKLHHSIGDGVSLISILLACGRRISDPEALPVLPPSKKRPVQAGEKQAAFLSLFFSLIWRFFLMIHYTLIDTIEFLFTTFTRKDSNPIKGDKGIEHTPKRFVHRVLSLDDIKLIKNSTNTTINDVLFAITNSALSHYIQRRYDNPQNDDGVKKTESSSEKMRIRGVVAYNMRPSAAIQDMHEVMHNGKELDLRMWGNMVGFILLPLKLCIHQDPLEYIHEAQAVINKKKLSFQYLIEYHIVKLLIKVIGMKKTAFVVNSFLTNVTFAFSSVMGPIEEISLFGYPLTYLAPSVHGFPVSILVHFQSYANKLIVSMALDEKLFPEPHQLCDDFQYSLQIIKNAVMKKDESEPKLLGMFLNIKL